MFKKALLGIGGLFAFTGIGSYLFVNSAPALPADTKELIAEVRSSTLPELVTGQTGIAHSGEVSIWYEAMSTTDTPKATILLVMGHGTTCMAWPDYFFRPLVDSGYQVVRYDNRGLGMSDWMPNWTKENPYTLEDMAKDGMAVLDALQVEKAHIIGASMGGMIAQRMAISHPQRVASLCSIMSSGYFYDPELPGLSPGMYRDIIRLSIKYGWRPNEVNISKMALSITELLKGNGDYSNDPKHIIQRALYEMRKRHGFNSRVQDQHTEAIKASGSRYDELGQIRVPTLVIHGTSDPLVRFEHAEKYAPMIPNAKTLWIEGMGHDLPEIYVGQVLTAIFSNINEASL